MTEPTSFYEVFEHSKLRTFENLERGKIVEAFVAWKSQWRQRVEYRVQIEQTERVHILGEGYIIFKMTVSNWAQLSWDRRICGWFVIRRLRPTSTPKFSPIGGVLGLQFLVSSHFFTFSLQSGGYDIIFKNFYKRYAKFDPIVASAIDQSNFCKKPQVKSSFPSEENREC